MQHIMRIIDRITGLRAVPTAVPPACRCGDAECPGENSGQRCIWL